MARPRQITLGPTQGVHQPSYDLRGYRDGDSRRPITGVDLRSVTAIQTNKSLQNITGTFTITLKDRGVRRRVREMDVFRIRLRGHRPGLYPVMVGVVDRARAAGSTDAYASQYDSIIEGRCVGKYYVINSLFLPVWDPEANLPTALTFGIGDAAKKVGGNRPYDIHRYLVNRFIFNHGQIAGLSGTPNARNWLDINTRFAKHLNYSVPFLQFDEDPMDVALKRLEILGFTEAWVDELGRTVYRHPQWDAPVHYNIPTSEFIEHDLPRGDEEVSTYVEVIPAGDPGIDSSIAQALRAGRAPVPSSYVNAAPELAGNVAKEFIIDTDSKGRVTAKGRRNHWYRLQKRLGLRPQQLSSPLLFDQAQAQRQAEGLMRWYGRTTKTISATIPGCPELRLGYTGRVHGDLDEEQLDRTFYIEQVGHDYVEGQSYTTSFYGTHGRDPWDPHFDTITLPKYSPEQLANVPGTLGPAPGNFSGKVRIAPGANRAGVPLRAPIMEFLNEMATHTSEAVVVTTGSDHDKYTTSGNISDHYTGDAADLGVGGDIRTGAGDANKGDNFATAALVVCGIDFTTARRMAQTGEGLDFTRNYSWHDSNGQAHRVQIGWRTLSGGNHFNHVHCGVRFAAS